MGVLSRSLFIPLITRYSLACWIPTALAIHSLAGFLPRSLSTRLLDSYRARYPLACWISIALAIHSLDQSLSIPLITRYSLV